MPADNPAPEVRKVVDIVEGSVRKGGQNPPLQAGAQRPRRPEGSNRIIVAREGDVSVVLPRKAAAPKRAARAKAEGGTADE